MLVATNGYTDAAVPALQRRFVPIGSYIIATEPLDDGVAAALLPRRPNGVRFEELPLLLPRDRAIDGCCSAGAPSSDGPMRTRRVAPRRFCATG